MSYTLAYGTATIDGDDTYEALFVIQGGVVATLIMNRPDWMTWCVNHVTELIQLLRWLEQTTRLEEEGC
jgi:hypothetical protein